VLNLALGFIVSGISWQAHIGGVVVGALVGLVLSSTRSPRRRGLQIAGVAAIVVLLVVVTVVAYAVTFLRPALG
jgi:hypothetical protein